jgi:hypothetical protein
MTNEEDGDVLEFMTYIVDCDILNCIGIHLLGKVYRNPQEIG